MPEYSTDQEQIEMIKRWWHDYGKAISIAIVIGLVIGFGWRYWHQHQIQTAENAAIIYQAMNVAIVKKDDQSTQQYANQLMQQFSKTPYATLAAFLLAKQEVQKSNLSQALSSLRWVIKNGRVKRFTQIARLRAARILISQNKSNDALKLLDVVDDASYQGLIDNVKGDAYAATGQLILAQKFYNSAKRNLENNGIDDPLLAMKLAQPVLKKNLPPAR